jgi:AcrR family transcriptional regulator
MPSVARMPQHERRARTRSALLGAAGRVFAERGYHGATLEDVVAEAGVSKGALYHYFSSKQELFLALLEEHLAEGMDDAEALIAEPGPEQGQIGLAAEGFLRRVGHDPRWLPLLLEFLAYGSRDEQARAGVVEHFTRPARDRVAVMLHRLPPETLDGAAASIEELSVGIAALANGLAIERAFDPEAVAEDLFGRLLGVLIAGLEAQSAAIATQRTSSAESR